MTLLDARDNHRILGIIGFAVGEKDGKLRLVKEASVKKGGGACSALAWACCFSDDACPGDRGSGDVT